MRLKREARAKGGFYVEPEDKLMFVMRLRGLERHPPEDEEDSPAPCACAKSTTGSS